MKLISYFQTIAFFQKLRMSYRKNQMNSYIPTKPKKYNEHDSFDLDTRLQQMTFNKIIQNPDEHFEKTLLILI